MLHKDILKNNFFKLINTFNRNRLQENYKCLVQIQNF